MKILHIIPTFYPATYWGGPIFSVYGLCNGLAEEDIELRVITTDSAGPKVGERLEVASKPVVYPNGYKVFFYKRVLGVSVSMELLAHLYAAIKWADVVHLTGVYSFPTLPTLLLVRLLGKPLVWSPRGALQNWQGTTSRRLKRLWDLLCNLLLSKKRSVLHVTSEEERADSERRIHTMGEIIPNGVEVPSRLPPREWRPGGTLRLLFIGRIHPKKGIENLLSAIRLLKDDNVILSVYGSGEREYIDSLVALVKRYGIEDKVRFCGHADGEAKLRAFITSDLSVVPSFTENFGMVVAEALAHGVPVVVSKGTPWSEVESRGCGLWVDNSPGQLTDAVLKLSERDLEAMGQRGRSWMADDYSWSSVAKRMVQLYARMSRLSR